jgi:ATP-dependent DNA ligase
MKHFARLIQHLDPATDVTSKVSALTEYIGSVADDDKLWMISLLFHRRPSKIVNYQLLGEWVMEIAGLPRWLYEESHNIVGDYAETIALLFPDNRQINGSGRSLSDCIELILRLSGKDESVRKAEIVKAWSLLEVSGRYIFNKLLTGGFRTGVSQRTMVGALTRYTGLEEDIIAIRLAKDWNPSSSTFTDLVMSDSSEEQLARPYPLYQAQKLSFSVEELGDVDRWQIEYKWNGVRAQVVVRGGRHYIWSDAGELITDKFPELVSFLAQFPSGTVLDGEIIAWKDGAPLPLHMLEKRIARKTVSKQILTQTPVSMIIFDVLEWDGEDIRCKPLTERRILLESVARKYMVQDPLIVSPIVMRDSWSELSNVLATARMRKCSALILKLKDSRYPDGSDHNYWWNWKAEPISVKAVLLYAQRVQGSRANVFLDFTFAVRDGDGLISFAKAYDGLDKEEYEEIADWIQSNKIERFGPILSVPARYVFELHFDDFAPSSRHKSGLIGQNPRIHRWIKNANADDADTLEYLRSFVL